MRFLLEVGAVAIVVAVLAVHQVRVERAAVPQVETELMLQSTAAAVGGMVIPGAGLYLEQENKVV